MPQKWFSDDILDPTKIVEHLEILFFFYTAAAFQDQKGWGVWPNYIAKLPWKIASFPSWSQDMLTASTVIQILKETDLKIKLKVSHFLSWVF